MIDYLKNLVLNKDIGKEVQLQWQAYLRTPAGNQLLKFWVSSLTLQSEKSGLSHAELIYNKAQKDFVMQQVYLVHTDVNEIFKD